MCIRAAELQKLGWTEGRNIQIDVRWAALQAEAMRRFAKELIDLKPDLILSNNTPTTAELLRQTRTIPIIFGTVFDPVGSGFVSNLASPGGNATGFATIEGSLGGKWLELLKQIAPRVRRVALLYNPATAPYAGYYLMSFNAAAASLGMEAMPATVGDVAALDTAVATHARELDSGLVVLNEDFTIANRAEIVSLAGHYHLPAIYPFRFFAELGGLLSYGVDLTDNFRRAAPYADRILRDARPSDLPVQAPVKFELVINMKTAKSLSLDVPLHLQQRADEVIE
jgi:putative ABC transport system substrate-binding protein